MKKEYSTPMLVIGRFNTVDCITSSTLWNGPDYPNGSTFWGGTNGDSQIGSAWWDNP